MIPIEIKVIILGALVLVCLDYFKKRKLKKKRQERLDKNKIVEKNICQNPKCCDEHDKG